MIRELLSELFFFSFLVSSAHKELVRDTSQRFTSRLHQMYSEEMSRTNSQPAVRDLDTEFVEEL